MSSSILSFDQYLQDASGYRGEADQVFAPDNVADLRQIVAQCYDQQIPLTVAGAGTGLTGARVPHGGYVVSLERFRKLEIKTGSAICGAGVLLSHLQQAAAGSRQFFGPNPTENSACMGGIFSTNAGGARSFHYGSVRYHALAVEVTLMDGKTMRYERGQRVDFPVQSVRSPQTTKNSAGYYLHPDLDWVHLFAGSEGTLGIVTELEVALLPDPPSILSGVVFFPSDKEALDAVEIWRSIPELRLLEFMDERALRLLRPTYDDIPKPAGAALLIEQNLTSEDDPEVEEWSSRLANAAAFPETSWFGFRAADQERFRKFRHTLPVMVTDMVRRNRFPKFSTDFAVPLERHRELHTLYKQKCEEMFPGQYTIFGHVGDANNHINLLPSTPEEAKRGEALIYDFAQLVVSMGGTVAAEHGIGKSKKDLLKLMYSAPDIEAMKSTKRILDSKWLLGQNTIFEM